MITDDLAKVFQSKRLVYRAFENDEKDRDFLYSFTENDPVNSALSNLSMIKPRSRANAEWVAENLAKSTLAVMIHLLPPPSSFFDPSNAKGVHMWAEGLSSQPQPIGYVVLGWAGDPPASQAQHRSIGIGISLAADYQGQGYGGEALNWALDWAFRFGGYHRVELSTVAYNERALRLYRRLGFVDEGRSRKAHWHDRQWHDKVHFGMLEEEWEALRGLGT